ncbi:MAG: hypothetical protein DHS20C11_27300 [Lysobacteraceae bacterium]|nr:MAG: hypothetical protein DHS20C11_27300 [Xanthomonadaceae bacterium]
MKLVLIIGFWLAAAIHLVPVVGLLGVDKLNALYGLNISDPSLEVLMRHRAVMFGLLGGLLAYAPFRPTLVWPALIGGFVSATSFIVIALLVGGYNGAVQGIVHGDLLALGGLVVAFIAAWRMPKGEK